MKWGIASKESKTISVSVQCFSISETMSQATVYPISHLLSVTLEWTVCHKMSQEWPSLKGKLFHHNSQYFMLGDNYTLLYIITIASNVYKVSSRWFQFIPTTLTTLFMMCSESGNNPINSEEFDIHSLKFINAFWKILFDSKYISCACLIESTTTQHHIVYINTYYPWQKHLCCKKVHSRTTSNCNNDCNWKIWYLKNGYYENNNE